MSEYNFITKFVSEYRKKKDNESAEQPKGKNQSKYADCEVVYKNEILKVEAKMLRDTRSNSSQFYNLLGEAIGTSRKCRLLEEKDGEKCESIAFLIPEKSKMIFDSLWNKKISREAGEKYCSEFNVRYLITFDEKQNIKFFHYCQSKNGWYLE